MTIEISSGRPCPWLLRVSTRLPRSNVMQAINENDLHQLFDRGLTSLCRITPGPLRDSLQAEARALMERIVEHADAAQPQRADAVPESSRLGIHANAVFIGTTAVPATTDPSPLTLLLSFLAGTNFAGDSRSTVCLLHTGDCGLLQEIVRQMQAMCVCVPAYLGPNLPLRPVACATSDFAQGAHEYGGGVCDFAHGNLLCLGYDSENEHHVLDVFEKSTYLYLKTITLLTPAGVGEIEPERFHQFLHVHEGTDMMFVTSVLFRPRSGIRAKRSVFVFRLSDASFIKVLEVPLSGRTERTDRDYLLGGMDSSPDGSLLAITDSGNDCIFIISVSGNTPPRSIAEFIYPHAGTYLDPQINDDGHLDQPGCVCFTLDGAHLIVNSCNKAEFMVFSLDGSFVSRFDHHSPDIEAFAVDGLGNMVVPSSSGISVLASEAGKQVYDQVREPTVYGLKTWNKHGAGVFAIDPLTGAIVISEDWSWDEDDAEWQSGTADDPEVHRLSIIA